MPELQHPHSSSNSSALPPKRLLLVALLFSTFLISISIKHRTDPPYIVSLSSVLSLFSTYGKATLSDAHPESH